MQKFDGKNAKDLINNINNWIENAKCKSADAISLANLLQQQPSNKRLHQYAGQKIKEEILSPAQEMYYEYHCKPHVRDEGFKNWFAEHQVETIAKASAHIFLYHSQLELLPMDQTKIRVKTTPYSPYKLVWFNNSWHLQHHCVKTWVACTSQKFTHKDVANLFKKD